MDGQKEVSVLAAGSKKNNTNTKETKKPKEKTGRSTGLIATLIILGAVIIVLAVVLVVVLISINNSTNSGDEDKSGSAQVEKKDDKKDDKDDDKKDTSSDNSGIEKGGSSNGYIGDHVRGKREAKVLVIEYADLQCPGCAQMMPIMDSIYKEYSGKVAFVYRHYTIPGHKNARSAAIAVEAAGKQDYFWEMLTEMFDRRTGWIMEDDDDKLTNVYVEIFKEASNNKGNVTQFKKDLKDDNLATKVDHDKTLGIKDKVSATPTIIVNGEEVDFYSSTNTKKAIEDAIDKALEGKSSAKDDDDDDDWNWDDDDDEDDDDDDDDWSW